MTIVKSDVLSFGVLLLRLFFWRSAPQDDRVLIDWVSILAITILRCLSVFIDFNHEYDIVSLFTNSMFLWQARPLLLRQALPELLNEDSEDVDIHGIYRVMSAAYICTRTMPDSRPCMSEVVNLPNPLWTLLPTFGLYSKSMCFFSLYSGNCYP